MVFIEKESKKLYSYRGRRVFTTSARAAMTFILQAKKRIDSRGILLPSYIGLSKVEGSGVFDPIRDTAIDYAFYILDQRLSPNLTALEEQLRGGEFQLALLIHYFGVPQVDVEHFVALCRRYGVQVIEDCAHTLLGGLGQRRLGSFGDYAIFSIHKSIGTVDGGYFLDHNRGLNFDSLPQQFRISYEALAEFADTDVVASSLRRQHNYHKVAEWVRSIPQLELLLENIPEGAVPLNCPVIVGEGMREQLYFKLIERGLIPTALYHTLIPEITPACFPQSHFVSTNIINLPTHPDIDEDDLIRYEKMLREVVNELFSI